MAKSNGCTRPRRPWALTTIIPARPQCPCCGEPIPDRMWCILFDVVICPVCNSLHYDDVAKMQEGITPATIIDSDEGPITFVEHCVMMIHDDHFRPHRYRTPHATVFLPKYDWQWGKSTLDLLEGDQPSTIHT